MAITEKSWVWQQKYRTEKSAFYRFVKNSKYSWNQAVFRQKVHFNTLIFVVEERITSAN
jgi:hypothetical protein